MKKGEVWLLNLDPTLGAEIKKTRPAIIVNDNVLGKILLKIILPVTDWKDRYEIAPWMIRIKPDSENGLQKESATDCFQVCSVSQEKFVRHLGFITDALMEEIKIGLSKMLSLDFLHITPHNRRYAE